MYGQAPGLALSRSDRSAPDTPTVLSVLPAQLQTEEASRRQGPAAPGDVRHSRCGFALGRLGSRGSHPDLVPQGRVQSHRLTTRAPGGMLEGQSNRTLPGRWLCQVVHVEVTAAERRLNQVTHLPEGHAQPFQILSYAEMEGPSFRVDLSAKLQFPAFNSFSLERCHAGKGPCLPGELRI